ncbi:SDR family oxidoreductase [Coraliomargarita sp. SDUM461003]|uniref:SDR family oxidoreductase n=1 Tax=Thalassobacterium maritimum TaxID=3041265 RepID=A0ABU1AYA6_9BACT|nr:SDR family oxidoreductase [Coraliomargarita sp. SDUM461003]MDQ8209110.1 SDR family oxidoreductase [Coraliomargarita sp. SDUM461003]
MKVFVAGATGATGCLLATRLHAAGHLLNVVVRSVERLPEALREDAQVQVAEAALLDLSDAELVQQVRGCDAVALCLGHNLSLKGIYGQPRRLVTEATRRLCAAIRVHSPNRPVKFLLMNTTGNRNRDLAEPIPLAQHCVIGLLRLILPPHPDNEQAADYLRVQVGQRDVIEWVAVRPDGLIDAAEVSAYTLHPSPTRSAIFDAGKTSRINVADFMARLIEDAELWEHWKGQMPVIYNEEV